MVVGREMPKWGWFYRILSMGRIRSPSSGSKWQHLGAHRTYESRRVVVTCGLSITIRFQNRVSLNDLVFQAALQGRIGKGRKQKIKVYELEVKWKKRIGIRLGFGWCGPAAFTGIVRTAARERSEEKKKEDMQNQVARLGWWNEIWSDRLDTSRVIYREGGGDIPEAEWQRLRKVTSLSWTLLGR